VGTYIIYVSFERQEERLDPCFTGCLVGTGIFTPKSRRKPVSILVLLDVWWVPLLGVALVLYRQWSRSLFYWMFGGYIRQHGVKKFIGACLDPCFTGCLVGTDRGDNYGVSGNRSRSLFYWMFGGYRLQATAECLQECLVSILVLLDVWWVLLINLT